jgi:hypothetical protein
MRDVTIMVASSIRDRPMVVETAKVGEILFDAVRNGLHGMSGTFPFDIIGCGVPFVLLPNTCRGLLYTMRSPGFAPEFVPPLNYTAIGSGRGVVEDVQRFQAQILFDNPGNLGLVALRFRNAIAGLWSETMLRAWLDSSRSSACKAMNPYVLGNQPGPTYGEPQRSKLM